MPNSSARQVVDVGTVIAETYTVEALIGRGGMGSVFLASHTRLPGKQVAIKLLHADLQDAEVIARFKREAEIASRLGHPNIVGVHDFNVLPDGSPYLILEYLHGESLAARLRRGPVPLDSVFSIARQVGSALAAAHRAGIVHRDLKPANIFLIPTEVDGKLVEIAKVLDFGISKMRGSTTVKTQESTLLGTPQYMAPEQAKGDHANVDQRTDIFALGSILYEMLAGHPAFSGDNIPEVCFKVVYEEPRPLVQEAPTAPPTVIESIGRAMAKAPAERFTTVGDFIERLTGNKLAVIPPSTGISIPPPDDDIAKSDAFANTMSSGDHGVAVSTPRPRVPTPLPVPEPPVNPQGATVQSLPPPVDSIPPTPSPIAPPRRSLAPVIGIALASAAIGALVLSFVTRRGPSPATPDAAPIATAPPPDAAVTPPPPDAAAIIVPVDAAPVVADAQVAVADVMVADAAVADARQPRRPPEPTGDEKAPPHGDRLALAKQEAAGGNFKAAGKLADAIIMAQDANAAQHTRARSIRAIMYCVVDNDEESAKLDLLRIPQSYRALRRAVLDRCHASNYLLTITQ